MIKDVPGWVEKGVYYRVTPDLIAMTAFGSAWDRWVKGIRTTFSRESLRPSKNHSCKGCRKAPGDTVKAFFRRFTDTFTSGQLADVRSVNRFVSLIETDPGLYLPASRRVIDPRVVRSSRMRPGPQAFHGDRADNLCGLQRSLRSSRKTLPTAKQSFLSLRKTNANCKSETMQQKLGSDYFHFSCQGTQLPLHR